MLVGEIGLMTYYMGWVIGDRPIHVELSIHFIDESLETWDVLGQITNSIAS